MVDPVANNLLRSIGGAASTNPSQQSADKKNVDDFAAALKDQLEQVSQMQNEANEGIQRLMTGESENITEVFTAARKAEVAFTLLMEIRNKLVDAYSEIRQIRV